MFYVVSSKELDVSLSQLNAEHVEVLVSRSLDFLTCVLQQTDRLEPTCNGSASQRGNGRRARSLQATVRSLAYSNTSADTHSFLFASYAEAMHQNEDAMSSNRLSKLQMDRRGSGHT